MKQLLVDGNNILYRTFWVASLKGAGVINPVGLFLLSLKKIITQYNVPASNIYIAWDRRLIKDKTNYRMLLYPEYKKNRDTSRREEIYKCCDKIRSILNTLGIKNMYPGVLEADDVLYWLDQELPGEKIVASGDSDLFQLVSETTVIYDLNKKKELNMDNFYTATGYSDVREYLNIKSLVGDKSDNITGVPKCGVKTARKILSNGIENISESNLKIFTRNKKMILLENGMLEHPDEVAIYQHQLKTTPTASLKHFKAACKKFNLQNIINNSHEWEDIFFNHNIHTCAMECINSLLKSHDNT